VKGQEQKLALKSGTFAFTYCQLPIVYRKSNKATINVVYNDGNTQKIDGNQLGLELSSEIFSRGGKISRLEVDIIQA